MPRISHKSETQPAAKPKSHEAPAEWLDSLDRSEAQLARGETIPLEPLLERLRTTIARMETRQAEPSKQ